MIKSNTPHTAIAHNYIAPLVRILVLAVFLVTVVQSSVSAEEWQNLRINNDTGRTITEVYFQPADASDWGDNMLSGTMPNGYGLDVSYISGFNYDFRFVFEDGSDVAWTGDTTIFLNGHTQVNVYVNSDGYYELSQE